MTVFFYLKEYKKGQGVMRSLVILYFRYCSQSRGSV